MKHLKNEKGIALVMVLVLSLIALAVVSTLIYLVIQGTKYSGTFKRYETAREAGVGGAEIVASLIFNRGTLDMLEDDADLNILGLGLKQRCACGDPDIVGDNTFIDGSPLTGDYICLCSKLCDPTYTGATYNWGACTDGTGLDPTTSADISFTLSGLGTSYDVDAKIVNTTLGNSDLSGEDLGGTGVVASTAGVIPTPPMPYLYRIEINSQNSTAVLERSRLSVLYAF